MNETTNLMAAIKLEHCADSIAWGHRRNGMGRDFQRWLIQWKKLGSDRRFTSVSRWSSDGNLTALQGVPDYTSANRDGNKGVYYWYTLPSGAYEIVHRYKLNAVRVYWLISENGTTKEVNQQEAKAWALQQSKNDTLASPS